jgi:hypothetical protein
MSVLENLQAFVNMELSCIYLLWFNSWKSHDTANLFVVQITDICLMLKCDVKLTPLLYKEHPFPL